jgi:hypothetical protein
MSRTHGLESLDDIDLGFRPSEEFCDTSRTYAPGVLPAPAPLFDRKDEDLATPRALAVLALVLFGLGFVVEWLVDIEAAAPGSMPSSLGFSSGRHGKITPRDKS